MARKEAQKLLGQIATGKDPVAEKRAEKMRQITLNEVQQLQNDVFRDYLLLILLTGLRRQEAATLRWDQVDLNAKNLNCT
ncbi:phage-related integrase [Legionella maceachernii]|uniref:Phage-related integrase n=1 Tax=Legionella maceachernii TaxID=466 RepID=A0A0W0VWL4_9GAMM|nr:phage-related integrase [Legionella maceachernii]SJZ84149.1 hypothetical protein SAMN02745128_01188 [Legionella maceachernii]SUO99300.1 Site-specific recombinase XerD [Legionella maceachernii]